MNRCIMIIGLVVVFGLSAVAQKNKETTPVPDLPVDTETGLFSYWKVNELPGVSKDQLFSRAMAWANGFYKNPGDVIREKDAAAGKILIKARFRISNEPDKKGVVTAAGDVMYSLTFAFKDGRYKYEITRINWQQVSYYPIERWKDTASPSYKAVYAHYLKQTDATLKALIRDFEAKLASEHKPKKDDW